MILEKLPDFCRMPEKTPSVAQIKSRLSPEKAAAGEDLRHMNRTTNTHSNPLRQYQSRCAGAGDAGGRREPPLQKAVELSGGGGSKKRAMIL